MYKVEGDRIHWITLDGQEKQAPLSNVDVPLSQELNHDRQGDFQIPRLFHDMGIGNEIYGFLPRQGAYAEGK